MNLHSILVTGGTGSFGKRIVLRLLNEFPEVERVIIYSRDELKQFEFQNVIPVKHKERCRFFIGDVRDKGRLIRALEGVDGVIHAAAMKQVPASEYNPFECILTNIIGAQNVIDASLDKKVKKIVALSTDKASSPINLYGATKLCSDKMFVASNNIKGERDYSATVVRYGNVFGSRGSVVPFFLNFDGDKLPITDERMTRFNITLDEGVDLVISSLKDKMGSQIVVPKIPSYRITDLAQAISSKAKIEVVGIRQGEKLHEEMINKNDAPSTLDMGAYYAIFPSSEHISYKHYLENNLGKPVDEDFKYSSDENKKFLTVSELSELVADFKKKIF